MLWQAFNHQMALMFTILTSFESLFFAITKQQSNSTTPCKGTNFPPSFFFSRCLFIIDTLPSNSNRSMKSTIHQKLHQFIIHYKGPLNLRISESLPILFMLPNCMHPLPNTMRRDDLIIHCKVGMDVWDFESVFIWTLKWPIGKQLSSVVR